MAKSSRLKGAGDRPREEQPLSIKSQTRDWANICSDFAPELVQWEPVAFNPTRRKALAYPVVATQHYAALLDAMFPQQWSVAYTPWRDAVICHLTITNRTMSQIGQAHAGITAYRTAADEALEGACHLFGLGRYLAQLPRQWENYDPIADCFTPDALDRLAALVKKHARTRQMQRLVRSGT